MGRIPNAVYAKEFREEAVRMVLEQGLSAYEVEPIDSKINNNLLGQRGKEGRDPRLVDESTGP